MPRKSKLPAALLLPVLPFAAWAGDKENAVSEAARQRFEKVENSATVPLPGDVHSCVEAEASAEKTTPRAERRIVQARGAYCAFLQALLAQDPAAMAQSAEELTAARGDGKNESAAILDIASALAILKSNAKAPPDPAAIRRLVSGLAAANCLSAGFAHTQSCNALTGAAYLWIGFSALRNDHLSEAATSFRHVDGTPWVGWLAGVSQSVSGRWREAVSEFTGAGASWKVREHAMVEWLGPQLPAGELSARLGFAQCMSGDFQAARPNLDAAIAAKPDDATSLFLRSRILDSLSDLEAATKAAGNPTDAHFFTAVLLERRREFPAAAREFSAALDTHPDPATANDIAAWRLLVAAAAGECSGDSDAIEKSASRASPLFPKEELAFQLLDCRVQHATSLDQLIALDAKLRPRYFTQTGNDALHSRIAASYIRIGIQAQAHQDNTAAASAFNRALEWTPRNAKARFSLGALFLGTKKYSEAEAEYRALLAADPADHEAQFWLGESILAAAPGGQRKTEACGLLQESIKIQDSAKRDQFATAFSTSPCAN